jgi:hypothetical protein
MITSRVVAAVLSDFSSGSVAGWHCRKFLAADRAEFACSEEAGQWHAAEQAAHQRGVVVAPSNRRVPRPLQVNNSAPTG